MTLFKWNGNGVSCSGTYSIINSARPQTTWPGVLRDLALEVLQAFPKHSPPICYIIAHPSLYQDPHCQALSTNDQFWMQSYLSYYSLHFSTKVSLYLQLTVLPWNFSQMVWKLIFKNSTNNLTLEAKTYLKYTNNIWIILPKKSSII